MLVCFCAVPFSVQVKNIGPVFDLGCFCCQFYFLSYLNAYFYFHACLICQRSEAIYLKWQNQTADVAECLRYFYNFSAFFFFFVKNSIQGSLFALNLFGKLIQTRNSNL